MPHLVCCKLFMLGTDGSSGVLGPSRVRFLKFGFRRMAGVPRLLESLIVGN